MSPFRLAFVAGVSLFATAAVAQTVGQAPALRQDAPVRVQYGPQQRDGFIVNGSMDFQITLK